MTVSTRSVAVAPSGSEPVSLKPTTCGTSIETGCPSMAASASMPPTPQPSTPSPLIIVVCESVPTSVSGYASGGVPLAASAAEDDPGQVFEVDLVHDPRVGRHDAEIIEGVLAPAEKRVPLAVALKFQLGVGRERVRRPGLVDLHRVVDHQLDRLERIDLPGVASQPFHRVAHGRQVDDRRHAREVLQQDPAGPKRNLAVRLRLGVPGGQALDVVGRHRHPVFVAEQVFQQDLEREWQLRHVQPLLAQGVEPVILNGLAARLRASREL